MREQLLKIQEHYHGGQTAAVTSFLTATQPPSQVDLDQALKQWNYSTRLARHMYDVSGIRVLNELLKPSLKLQQMTF